MPDLRGRTPIHAGNGPGLSSRRIGQKSGTETNTMNITQMPSHNHTAATTVDVKVAVNSQPGEETSPVNSFISTGSDSFSDEAGANQFLAGTTGTGNTTIGNSGGNQQMNNMPPFLVTNYIIALVGLYPSRN